MVSFDKAFAVSHIQMQGDFLNGVVNWVYSYPKNVTILGGAQEPYTYLGEATLNWNGNPANLVAGYINNSKSFRNIVLVFNQTAGGWPSSTMGQLAIPGDVRLFACNPGSAFSVNNIGSVYVGAEREGSKGWVRVKDGNIFHTGQILVSSDRKLKSNIVDADLQKHYEDISKIQVRQFDKGHLKNLTGVIAQEVEEVDQDLVEDVDGIKSVKVDSLVHKLLATVKVLQNRIDELQNKPATRSRRKKCPT
jgi:hypothetical protein